MSSLTLVRRIRARPSIVFDALTTPEGIACWWGPDAGPVLVAETDLRVDGRYRVRFRMLDGSEHECSGEYLEEAGTPYQERLIGPDNLATAAYRALQPFGRVPAIETDELRLFESGAIVLHIAEKSEALMPSDAN